MLASSLEISSSTPLKHQHSNPNPNPLANQLGCFDFLTPACHTSNHPSQTLCLPWISYPTQNLMLDSCKMLQKQSEAYHRFLWDFFLSLKQNFIAYRFLKCPLVQIAFLKITSCDNQALVGCTPIAAVGVHLKLKS